MTGIINSNMAALKGVFVDILAGHTMATGFTQYRVQRKDKESIFGKLTEWIPAQNVIILLDKVESKEVEKKD
jgi:hypothetical protein